MTGAPLCALEDVPDGGSQGFVAETVEGRRAVLAVRRGRSVFVYVNSCPHIGAPLDFRPGQFLNLEKTHIQCANHGALFRIEDGHCVSGPCVGKALQAVPVELRDDTVLVADRT